MGLRRLRLGGRSALRFTLLAVLALALSEGSLQHAQAQAGSSTGVVYITFGGDTPPTNGVLCRYSQYKILVQPAVIVGKVQQHVNAHIDIQAALNPITPSSLDLGAHNGAAIFYYNAQNIGTETITVSTSQNPTVAGKPMTGPAFAHPKIADGKLQFEVKDCLYKVLLVYSLKAPRASVIAYTDEIELTRNSDGTLEGDGSFDFQQTVNGTGCGTQFTAFSAPTHIKGTVVPIKSVAADPNAGVTLNFEYGAASTTFTADCPIAGKKSAPHDINVASLGVTSVHVPVDGGVKQFSPSLGGKFTVIVTQDVKQ